MINDADIKQNGKIDQDEFLTIMSSAPAAGTAAIAAAGASEQAA